MDENRVRNLMDEAEIYRQAGILRIRNDREIRRGTETGQSAVYRE